MVSSATGIETIVILLFNLYNRSLQCLETLAQKAGIHDITPDDCKYDVANTLLNLDRGHEFIKQSVDMSELNKQQMEANAQAQAAAQAAQVQAQVQQQQMQQVALQQQAAQQQQEQQQAQQALVPAQSPHMQQVTVGTSGKQINHYLGTSIEKYVDNF